MIEEIYANLELRQRLKGDSGGLRSTMPEIAFEFFHQRFGSKAIVDEYVGSLNNTLLHYEKVRRGGVSKSRLSCFHGVFKLGLACLLGVFKARMRG